MRDESGMFCRASELCLVFRGAEKPKDPARAAGQSGSGHFQWRPPTSYTAVHLGYADVRVHDQQLPDCPGRLITFRPPAPTPIQERRIHHGQHCGMLYHNSLLAIL